MIAANPMQLENEMVSRRVELSIHRPGVVARIVGDTDPSSDRERLGWRAVASVIATLREYGDRIYFHDAGLFFRVAEHQRAAANDRGITKLIDRVLLTHVDRPADGADCFELRRQSDGHAVSTPTVTAKVRRLRDGETIESKAARARAAIEAGATVSQVAEWEGVAQTTISYWLIVTGQSFTKQRQHKLQERAQRWLAEHQAGATVKEIADTDHVTINTVYRSLSRSGASLGRHRLDDVELLEKLKAEYEAGKSMIQIARENGTDKTTMKDRLLSVGVELREFKNNLLTEERRQKVEEQIRDGLGSSEIAEFHDVTFDTAREWIRKIKRSVDTQPCSAVETEAPAAAPVMPRRHAMAHHETDATHNRNEDLRDDVPLSTREAIFQIEMVGFDGDRIVDTILAESYGLAVRGMIARHGGGTPLTIRVVRSAKGGSGPTGIQRVAICPGCEQVILQKEWFGEAPYRCHDCYVP